MYVISKSEIEGIKEVKSMEKITRRMILSRLFTRTCSALDLK
jgi:hypothetical protein